MALEYYRTKDGLADYGFSIERKADGSWRAYIVSQPSYQGRDEKPTVIHRLTDSADGRHYVCFEPEPRSYSAAKQVAEQWADLSQRYIRLGTRFG